jgi:phage/plasmid-associated DNA primase
MLQQPGQHAATALVLRSAGHGTGKGHLADKLLGKMFKGQQYIHVQGPGLLTGQFNSQLSGKVYVFADESTWIGDHRANDRLKGLVTEDTIVIERKFLEPIEEPSALHIVIASNSDRPVRIEPGDRRFTVVEVGEERKQDLAYFGALHDELKDGGRSAFLDDMLKWPVDWDAARRPYSTEAKADLAERSLDTLGQWWLERLRSGVLYQHGSAEDGWPKLASRPRLHADYMETMERFDVRRDQRLMQSLLGQALKKFGALTDSREATGGSRRKMVDGHYTWEMRPLAACRDAWRAARGLRADYFAEYEID